MGRRDNKVMVSLNGDELARLDEMRVGASRAVYLRTLLQEPLRFDGMPTHSEAVAILARMARDGKVAAAVALERALCDEAGAAGPEGELERLLCGD
jgi:hypothetical protein